VVVTAEQAQVIAHFGYYAVQSAILRESVQMCTNLRMCCRKTCTHLRTLVRISSDSQTCASALPAVWEVT
jgi:hypothetical protein